jgi:hypothetical protein
LDLLASRSRGSSIPTLEHVLAPTRFLHSFQDPKGTRETPAGHGSSLFDQFTPEETELHAIVRSITEHALRPLNQQMSNWLANDIDFRTARGAEGKRGQLANKLNLLDSHLLLWHAKYEAWIPANRSHALVYMADEEQHGVGFPRGIERLVDDVIRELGGSVPPEDAYKGAQEG